jgi:hypothetical protein
MPLLDRAKIVQVCYVTHDIEALCHKLHDIYGIGPWLTGRDPLPAETVVHRGKPATEDLDFSRAFGQSGDLNIEIIQPHSKEQNAFWDSFPLGTQGVHHVAIFADDYAAERQAFIDAGYEIATEFDLLPDCAVSFIDTREDLGHMIELYEDHVLLRTVYQQTREAAENWDGKDLIRGGIASVE